MPKLMSVPEDLLGRRLVPLMLSRFVLLDQTACQFLIPHLLTPCLGRLHLCNVVLLFQAQLRVIMIDKIILGA